MCQEFEDHFEDEVDFTPPAEDTPSMQSPAEVYTLAVPPVPLPGPPHLQLPRITGQKHVPCPLSTSANALLCMEYKVQSLGICKMFLCF